MEASAMNADTSNQVERVAAGRLSSGRMSSVGGGSFRIRHSMSSSGRVAPEVVSDDIHSEVVSQAGDTGERHSRRYSGITPHSSMENFMSVEDVIVPMVYSLFTDPPMYIGNNDPSAPPQESQKHFEDFEKDIPEALEYISRLVHLAVFGILGVFTRYLLQKLFGPQVAGVTSDQSFVYLDLPSNMVGSFLMGWFGVVFKGDISHVSDLLAIGLTTGYLGSLTTFSGWNQEMLDLCVNGRWVDAVLGAILGLWLSAESIRQGIETAKGFKWLLKRSSTCLKGDTSSPRNIFRVDNLKRHMIVLIVLLLTLGALWSLSGVLFKKWHDGGNANGQLWLACIVGPFGVWVRWFLARLNGRGIGRKGSLKWIPFGTLIANILAACVMASLATIKKVDPGVSF